MADQTATQSTSPQGMSQKSSNAAPQHKLQSIDYIELCQISQHFTRRIVLRRNNKTHQSWRFQGDAADPPKLPRLRSARSRKKLVKS
jgi:hypothetical protein